MIDRSSLPLAVLVALAAQAAPGSSQALLEKLDGVEGMFGTSVAVIGDVNQDLCADYVVGSPWASSAAGGPDFGMAQVFSGKTGELLYTVSGSNPGERMGQSVAAAGFIDGDDVPDFIVGAVNPSFFTIVPGKATVFSGIDGAPIHTVTSQGTGTPMFDNFGTSVDGAGDVDNDGVDDFIVGASQLALVQFGVGFADVFSGATGDLLFRLWGLTPFDAAGFSVGGAGDLDQDGHADVIVGAPQLFIGTGFAVVISGREALQLVADQGDTDIFFNSAPNPGDLALRIMVGTGLSSRAGWSVSRAGDVDGDTVEDYVVGAPFEAGGAGRVTVFSGASRARIFFREGSAGGDQLGYRVSGGYDVTGDGVPDVLAGAWQTVVQGTSSLAHNGPGFARLFSGDTGGTIFTVTGASFGSEFGASGDLGPDVNGDGVGDMLVGAPNDNPNGPMSGSVWVFNAKQMLLVQ